MVSHALTSLAILKVNSDQGSDYIDMLLPFVRESIRKLPEPVVTVPGVAKIIGESYGLEIPQAVLRSIFSRAAKLHYITKRDGVYYRNKTALEPHNIDILSDKLQAEFSDLVTAMQRFISTEWGDSWDTSKADAALLTYINEGAIQVILSDSAKSSFSSDTKSTNKDHYMVSRFILDLHMRRDPLFGCIDTLAKGSMLSNVILFPDIGKIQRKFENLDVYLDTNFLLRLLGFSGNALQLPCVELVKLLLSQNVRLFCFPETMNEMRGVLDFALNTLRRFEHRNGQASETLQFFIDSGKSPSDVELLIARLEIDLRKIPVLIKDRPPFTPETTIDEPEFSRILQADVGYVRQGALQHDLDATAAVFRLRRGRQSSDIESCKALFLTTNVNLVRAARRYCIEHQSWTTNCVPLCISDESLATIAWIKSPMKAPDLPKWKVIADCYAALNPPGDIWNKYVREIEMLIESKSITDDDFYLLRYSSISRIALMENTHGDFARYTDGTVYEVLEQSKRNITAEKDLELSREMAARLDAEQEALNAKSEARMVRTKQIEKITNTARVMSRFCTVIVMLVLLISLIGASITTIVDIKGNLFTVSIIPPIIFWVTAAFSLFNWIYGTSVKSLAVKLETWCTDLFALILMKISLPEI